MRTEIRLSGSGGQGLITAGIILARAASLYDGKNAVQTQSYGPEARGGASKAEVIISDKRINYPKVQSPDVFVALTQEALDKYIKGVKEGGLVLIDDMLVKSPPQGNFQVYSLPVLTRAAESVGSIMTANILTLALVNTLCPLVSEEALEKAVKEMFPPKATELNMKALSVGRELAKSVKV